MNEREHDNQIDERFGDVLSGLNKLAQAIDRAKYPGAAWSVRSSLARRGEGRPHVVRLWWCAGAIVEAAAAVFLVAGMLNLVRQPLARTLEKPRAESQELVWIVPQVDTAIAGQVSLEIPELSLAADADGNGVEWATPSISLPTFDEILQDLSNSEESTSQTTG